MNQLSPSNLHELFSLRGGATKKKNASKTKKKSNSKKPAKKSNSKKPAKKSNSKKPAKKSNSKKPAKTKAKLIIKNKNNNGSNKKVRRSRTKSVSKPKTRSKSRNNNRSNEKNVQAVFENNGAFYKVTVCAKQSVNGEVVLPPKCITKTFYKKLTNRDYNELPTLPRNMSLPMFPLM